jgi:hypothetical protein
VGLAHSAVRAHFLPDTLSDIGAYAGKARKQALPFAVLHDLDYDQEYGQQYEQDL